MKVLKSFRLDERLLEQATKLNINLRTTVEAALAQVVRDKSCPYCKQKLKPKKEVK